MNDLEESVPQHLVVNICKYADDCTLDELVGSGKESHAQEVLNSMDGWAPENKMFLNPKKTNVMWICFKESIPEPPQLSIGGTTIKRVNVFKLLGVLHQNNLKWNSHVEYITKKANKRLFFLRECRRANLPTEVGITCYVTKNRPLLARVWSSNLGRSCTLPRERTRKNSKQKFQNLRTSSSFPAIAVR